MSRVSFGGASGTATVAQVACSTVTAQLFTAGAGANMRQIVPLTAPVYISGSSTATSTNAHVVPTNVPFTLTFPTYRGALWGISTAPTQVSLFSC